MRKQAPLRHPIDIRHDERIAALIGERGATGYGLYWLLIETIYREPDMRIYYTKHRIRRLSAALGITSEELKTLVSDLVYVYELLIIEDDYLSSTITYRKPRKQKQPAETPAETQSTETVSIEIKGKEPGIAAPQQATERQQAWYDTNPGRAENRPQKSVSSVSASMEKIASLYGSFKTSQHHPGSSATAP